MPRKKVIDAPMVASTSSTSKYVFIGVIALAVIGIFVSLFLGRTDSDAIDVSGVITTSNTAAREAGGENAAQQSVSTHQNLPNGGLVGKGDEGTPPPPPPVVEEVASTSASTTPESDTTSTEDEPSTETSEEAGATDAVETPTE